MTLGVAITTISVAALAINGIGYMIFSPMYETGIWRVVVPVLSAINLPIAYAVWKRLSLIKKWLLPIGIGTLIVAVPFWGKSSEIQGAFATPMLVVESAGIVAAICLIVLALRQSLRD